jgi:hypothetical protein
LNAFFSEVTVRFSVSAAVLGALVLGSPAASQVPGTAPASSVADSASVPDNAELARRVDQLSRELDDLKLGPVAKPESHWGFGPAASKVYGVEQGVSIGGYGEMLVNGVAEENESGAAVDAPTTIDFLRQILYVGYKFDEHLLLNSEIEFEHASTEHAGAVSVEFANIDALLHPEFNLRGGLLLVPMGIYNEMHEPPTFLPARRPETERRIIPSTWGANGAGVFGATRKGLSYRAYVIESLNAAGFEAGGVREGRQGGSEALFEDIAGVARVGYDRAGISAAASVFSGNTSQGARTPVGRSFGGRTTIYEAHVDMRHRGVRFRALAAGANVDDAADINAANGLTGDGGGASVGSRMWGAYAEAGYELWSRLHPGSRFELIPFARYEGARYPSRGAVWIRF